MRIVLEGGPNDGLGLDGVGCHTLVLPMYSPRVYKSPETGETEVLPFRSAKYESTGESRGGAVVYRYVSTNSVELSTEREETNAPRSEGSAVG